MKLSKIQHSPPPYNHSLFSYKRSIIYVRLSSKYTCLINYHSVVTIKSMFFFKLLSLDFSLKETLLVKTIHCKTKNDIGKYYHWYSKENLQKLQQFQLFAVFSFHVTILKSSGLIRLKKILSTTNKFPSNGLLLHS